MYTVDEVARELSVSKVTIYAKLKKFNDKVVLKQGKKYIPEDLVNLIKEDLKLKSEVKNELKNDSNKNDIDQEISIDREDLINLNKDLINTLIEQLKEKDNQLREKDNHINQLHKLIENSQVLLGQEQKRSTEQQLILQERSKEVDTKIEELKEKLENRRTESNKGLFSKLFKK